MQCQKVNMAPIVVLRRISLAAVLAVPTGCAVNPSTGRNQLIALSAAQISHADMGYTLAAAARGLAPSSACVRPNPGSQVPDAVGRLCPSAAASARFALQVERIGEELALEARSLAPALFTRISEFRIEIETDPGAGTASSASGRISIDAGLAALDPTDDVVAFLIAREMGHVIARHGEEDSGARLAFSALTAVVPIGGWAVRFIASMVGSQALKSTWAEGQRREADDLALALLERCDRPLHVVSLNLLVGLKRNRLPEDEWGGYFAQSLERVVTLAFVRARVPARNPSIQSARAGSAAPEATLPALQPETHDEANAGST